MRHDHAGSQAKIERHRAGGSDHITLPGPQNKHGRFAPQCRPTKRRQASPATPFVRGHCLEGMLGMFAAPPHFAHGRSLMGGEGFDVCLARATIDSPVSRPTRTRPPPTAPWDGAGTRIIVDGVRKARLGPRVRRRG